MRDGNRRNRSAVFEWEVADCLGDNRRRYSPAFALEDFTFQVCALKKAALACNAVVVVVIVVDRCTTETCLTAGLNAYMDGDGARSSGWSYTFRPTPPPLPQLIVDPAGNPYVPLGHPGVSVYLTCIPTR